MNCPVCGCCEFSDLGSLGKIQWLRCRNCGSDVQREEEEGLNGEPQYQEGWDEHLF